jgi:hypothetical protein
MPIQWRRETNSPIVNDAIAKSEELNQHLSQTVRMLRATGLQSPFVVQTPAIAPAAITPENTMSITGLNPGAIKAAIEAAKQKSQDEMAVAMAAFTEAQNKAASVPVAINQVAAQMTKEADDALQELATFTKGAPA